MVMTAPALYNDAPGTPGHAASSDFVTHAKPYLTPLHFPRCRLPALTAAVALCLGHCSAALAAPTLHCRLQDGEAIKQFDILATTDPYRAPTLATGHFGFKAVMVGSAEAIDYITLYTYYDPDPALAGRNGRGARLLQQVKYLQPQARQGGSLTGTVYLYEPRLGRELSYECALQAVPA